MNSSCRRSDGSRSGVVGFVSGPRQIVASHQTLGPPPPPTSSPLQSLRTSIPSLQYISAPAMQTACRVSTITALHSPQIISSACPSDGLRLAAADKDPGGETVGRVAVAVGLRQGCRGGSQFYPRSRRQYIELSLRPSKCGLAAV